MQQIPYEYRNLPIPGGGYVTGFLYSEKERNVLYIRTDIGGTYRFNFATQTFENLISHVTMEDLSETFPISFAIDEEKPGSLYIACGVNRPKGGVLAISQDYGTTFCTEKIPVLVHGNLNGRGTDERLLTDGERIWFASQQEGLLYTDNCGKDWNFCESLPEKYCTFVTKICGLLIVGTAGVTTSQITESGGKLRGHSLYISRDDGRTFEKMPMPASRETAGCRYNGLTAQRHARDEKYFYVTFSSTGRNSYVLENGYSCDSGDCIDGHAVRYPLEALQAYAAGGILPEYEDITPGAASVSIGIGQDRIEKGEMLEYGLSGISVSRQTPGMLVLTTMVKYDGDSIFVSYDYGASYRQILYGLEEGEITFRAPYMRPECNGGHSLIHWLSDFAINPFDDNEGWFNSGTGVFRTTNLKDEVVKFTDWCDGIEETVHLNVYALPSGPVRVIDILGDLGGFAFEDLDTPCGNSFADEQGNRYITCINADFAAEDNNTVVITPRGNWTGKTKGGLILSHDQGRTVKRLPLPYGLTEDLDLAFRRIEQPNVNSGWVALSPDGKTIVWSVADGIDLPVKRVVVSKDGGATFSCCVVKDLDGRVTTDGKMKVFSDRKKNHIFYGFGEASQFYISRDGGSTFVQYPLPDTFPVIEFGLIDCANKTEVRADEGKTGVFYMAIGAEGIWKLTYEEETDSVLLLRLTEPGISALRLGLGLGRPGGDYLTEEKAIYFNGTVDGVYGFYRTCDQCKSFVRLNNEQQMFGEINSIDGDCREFGLFYLATGSNGIKYGREI